MNTYKAEGKAQFAGTKELEGRELAAGEFTFELYDSTGALLETVTNDADGKFTFPELTYVYNTDTDETGTHTYTVKEKKGELGGVGYDEKTYTITVEVSDNGDGTLNVAVTGGEAIKFVNTYEAEGMLELDGTKKLEGRALAADEFSFELYRDGTKLQTVTNDADGKFTFDAIKYTLADIANSPITYTVKEVKGSETGVVYDVSEYEIVVTVEDNGDGKLNVTKTIKKDGTETGAIVFTNEYATVELPGEKTWNDDDNRDGKRPTSITINLMRKVKGSDAEPEQIDTITVEPDAEGKWSWNFKDLPKYAPGSTTDAKTEYEYSVTENPVDEYTTEYDGNNVINTHAPEKTTITAIKVWSDRSDAAKKRSGVKATFHLQKTVDGVSEEVGSVEVGKEDNWTYTWEDLPVYENGKKITYSVKEVLDKPNNYESDTTDWTDVENGGSITITNTLPKDDTPGTGDNSQIKLWLAMTLTSAAGLSGMLWLALRKKKREEN